MLTRNEAKGVVCPLKFGRSHGASLERCEAAGCPRWSDAPGCSMKAEYQQKMGKGMPNAVMAKCRLDRGLAHCAGCPERFGYCR